jgi:hypothetical protein
VGLVQKIIFSSCQNCSPLSTVDTILYTGSMAGQYACLCDISSKAGSAWEEETPTNIMLIQSLSINLLSFSSKFGNYWFIYYFKAVSSIPLVFRFGLVGPEDMYLYFKKSPFLANIFILFRSSFRNFILKLSISKLFISHTSPFTAHN